ncbi:MAG: transketolase [Ferrovibrio sp.]|uniref:transketolase n=1 Tax=Ferrovibrio sp. TaxID=1917215 RepID=UPI00391CD8E1
MLQAATAFPRHDAPVSHADMANAIRALAMDAVQKANSGHPGMPMGMADVATVLFSRFLKFDPKTAAWPDRDRFVLSAGHGSMLLYALLYLTGYPDMTLDELKNFRQIGSRTAGHPEFGHAGGIETTTGPLGQGIATAVGMAMAERLLAAQFGKNVVDHYTYVIAGDGCLMEGISHEAVSMAGHLKLNKLIVLFDDNQISIDGPTSLSVSDDQIARFQASGWATIRVDGHDPEAVAAAIAAAQKSDRPSLIACRTVIGYGAPTKAGTAATHGSPLGPDEIKGAREKLGWPHAPFEIPETVLKAWRDVGIQGAAKKQAWDKALAALPAPQRAEWDRRIKGELPADFAKVMDDYKARLATEKPKWATRKASQMALEVINPAVPETIGGSADLTGSNNTKTAGLNPIKPGDFSGRYVYYGVREHGMAAAMNGIALHGGLIPYGGTFLVFTDYCRPSIRLSALMEQRVVYVMTHDSIGLGEDGPTHQPVEHLAALRAIPNLLVLRPADAVETAEAWQVALEQTHRPSVLALTRQDLPAVRTSHRKENLVAKGGYELIAADGAAKVTLLASGSEIAIAMTARDMLQKDGIPTRVVSMPSFELFDAQDVTYQEKVLGPGTVRVAIEAGVRQGWDRYLGIKGGFVGMSGFGASGPYEQLYKHFGITPEAVAQAAKQRL